ncbi:MAG: hypothetical protein EAZ37_09765 [Burkholderiales bacterium]|nr:MAG: hypothetical protein EAZ37_09765 [Burkholderiales bacterium]
MKRGVPAIPSPLVVSRAPVSASEVAWNWRSPLAVPPLSPYPVRKPVPEAFTCGPAPEKFKAPATSKANTPPELPFHRLGRKDPAMVREEYCGTRIT